MKSYNYVLNYEDGAGGASKSFTAVNDTRALMFVCFSVNSLLDISANDAELGAFVNVRLFDTTDNICLIATLSRSAIKAIIQPVEQIRAGEELKFTLRPGGVNYILQARLLLNNLSTELLTLFNTPEEDFILPACYSTIAEAQRDLQYLTELCKIAEFNLEADPQKTW